MPVRQATIWTEAQKKDTRHYEPGMVVEFHKAVAGVRHSVNGVRETTGGFKRGESAVVLRGGANVVLMRTDGTQSLLPVAHADRFQVYRSGELSIAKGDQIRITRNGETKVKGQKLGSRVDNGDIYKIEGFTKEGDFRLAAGKLLPRNYGHIAYGYVMTSQRSQGNTVDREFVDWNSETLAAVNRQGAYVTSSRFRDGITYFVDDKEQVKTAIQRGGERVSALEFMKGQIGEEKVTMQKRLSVSQHLERNRVANYLKGRVAAIAQAARNLVQGWRNRGGMQYA